MHRLLSLPVVAICASLLPSQEPLPPALETRLRHLEREAARAARLEVRVAELEGRLARYEEVEVDAELEAAINALAPWMQEDPPVRARKAASLVLGGQLRLRTEYRTVSLYGAPDPGDTDEDLTIQRTRIHADAGLSEHIRIFVEIQDSRTWGEELGPLGDTMGVDLHQGFLELDDVLGSGLTLRAGRFEQSLWNQRLLSPLDWHPVGRAWDGFQVTGGLDEVDLVGGYQVLAEGPVVDSDKDRDLYWAAATCKAVEDHELGAAFFWLDDKSLGNDTAFGTPALHASGRSASFDYSADLAANFGESGSADIEAYAAALEAGFTFSTSWNPRLAVEWTWASGDDDPADGTLETFNPLFPFGHAYQGYLDIFAWRNGHDLSLHLEATPSTTWWLELVLHSFWLDQPEDSWFGAAGTPIRTAPGADATHVGLEVDLSAKYRLAPSVLIWFGYSHFFPGSYVDDTGPSPDTDWVFVQVTAGF